jgi:hypothetical protein
VVPPRGVQGEAGHLGPKSARPSLGEAASSYTVMLDKKVFFQRQIEECRELLRHAVNDEDRAFWQQAAERWEGTLRQISVAVKKTQSRSNCIF